MKKLITAVIILTSMAVCGFVFAGEKNSKPMFTDNGNGTVTDNRSGLIWLKNANCYNWQNWDTAQSKAAGLASGACGLTDGSKAGDWHMPEVWELTSLIDKRNNPALPTGHPFSSVQTSRYWSSTTLAHSSSYVWYVYLYYGSVIGYDKGYSCYVWPVRYGPRY